jgi:GINS complex subunit 4
MLESASVIEDDDLVLVQQAYMNERHAPELLPYQKEIIQNILDVLTYQQATHLQLPHHQASPMRLLRDIYELEIERVKYLLTSYIEIRIEKVCPAFLHLNMCSIFP